ncbi:MAG: hypothetical protein M1834_002641 [Cirrosporium novae-zelandiae]|nr:MAG: hypothetical protein M1834_002641 [Cirrosporium novae-zelandiae]
MSQSNQFNQIPPFWEHATPSSTSGTQHQFSAQLPVGLDLSFCPIGECSLPFETLRETFDHLRHAHLGKVFPYIEDVRTCYNLLGKSSGPVTQIVNNAVVNQYVDENVHPSVMVGIGIPRNYGIAYNANVLTYSPQPGQANYSIDKMTHNTVDNAYFVDENAHPSSMASVIPENYATASTVLGGSSNLADLPLTPEVRADVTLGRASVTDDIPFRCTQCNATFARQADLNRHIKKHKEGLREFQCHFPGCAFNGSNGFYRKDKLKDHQRMKHKMVI